MTDLNSLNIQEFYELLSRVHGVSAIYSRIHRVLCEFEPDMSLDVQKIFYLYFSLLEDGNTRIALDADCLYKKWRSKWNTLISMCINEDGEKTEDAEISSDEFINIIKNGIQDIQEYDYAHIIERRAVNARTPENECTKTFVIAKDDVDGISYLYATKYFDAKCVIEAVSARVFNSGTCMSAQDVDDQVSSFSSFFDKEIDKSKVPKDYSLTKRQLEAIIRGQNENLIITGGPGTGKTTVICYLLWKLLKSSPEYMNWNIKLAAPSGKAADRMRESLLSGISKFKDQSSDIYNKLRELESYTIHRLLKYTPNTNRFLYCDSNRFPENTIFVIDEASMIDVDLFSKFMEALPENGYRLFILGDPNQLPSVEAGAVLGDMLESDHSFVVKLNESKRFNDRSDIGRLAMAIKFCASGQKWPADVAFPSFSACNNANEFVPNDSGIVKYISLHSSENVKNKEDINRLIHSWTECFYIKTDFLKLAHKVYVDPVNGLQGGLENLNALWKLSEKARLLSAERRGMTGVLALNKLVQKSLSISDKEQFFVGQILILTKNQSIQKLYNGDCGIVIGEAGSGRLHLLLKKIQTRSMMGAVETASSYVTYPLSIFPTDALESAFAITIHKSQGSGYDNIMMFLPERIGHPLLNNQMIYTGVTRTQGVSLTIVASQEAFTAGCQTMSVRDTGIHI